jgi:hypothetical protein
MLNIHAIIDFCCGAKDPKSLPYTEKQELLAQRFTRYGFQPIQPSSIQKWIERGSIPGDRLAELHVIAKKQGKRLNLNRYLIDNSEAEAKKLFG